ncbi:oxysterol-binding protein-related protein 11-like isoform X2 [Zophobas morio]|uniref:oxysterol-binding protein-related protein 11-like isoform X2 n=1 Tax=Zophobas morio TaxID=2755281 RepID=UPI003083D83B
MGKALCKKEGHLIKWTNYVTGWKERYFCLRRSTFKKDKNSKARGKISLTRAHIMVDSKDDCLITVIGDSKMYFLKALKPEERDEWVKVLNSVSKEGGFIPAIKESQLDFIEKQIYEIRACKKALFQHIKDLSSHLKETQQDQFSLSSALLIKDTANILTFNIEGCAKIITDVVRSERSTCEDLKSMEAVLNEPSYESSTSSQGFYDAHTDQSLEHSSQHDFSSLSGCSQSSNESSSSPEKNNSDGQKSVILSILSQLRMGMDLTKVTLPTFVLERRSLLEMYADFMCHPDIFSRTPDGSCAKERMMNVVYWYLTCFHEGRKSGVAKKPYNPLLGEVFFCRWPLGEKLGECRYVAEQVSHHPPVSAFYAESKKKRVYINSYIHTKSKFLGTSVGVQNIGQAKLSLLDFEEDYTITWPSAYARSILSVPWVELTGKTVIHCEQSSFQANIEFLSKPVFGGAPHCITCSVRDANNQEICSIEGKWNDKLYITDAFTKKTNLFADTQNLKVIKKRVKPIYKQGADESRRRWKNVSDALKRGDIAKATEEKSKLEKIQREEAEDREKKNVIWVNKHFQKSSHGGWLYMTPLSKEDT